METDLTTSSEECLTSRSSWQTNNLLAINTQPIKELSTEYLAPDQPKSQIENVVFDTDHDRSDHD